MEQPIGYNKDKNKICLLEKSIYGLKQSGRAWNQTIHDTLIDIGYIQSKCEPCVYIKKNKNVLVIIAIYIDDLFVFSSSKTEKSKLINMLQEKYEIKFLGPVKNCLGMKVTRDRINGTISLNQTQYIKDLLARFGMSDAKPVSTPMVSDVKLKKSSKSESKYPYQQLIGGLLYLAVCTRPDIAYAASLLSQFNTSHDESHCIAAKRVLRYLVGTIDYKLMYKKNEEDIEFFADSDWGGNTDDRKSYTGLVMKLGDGAVSWESKKQKTIALSSTEAEYLSMCEATKEVIFLRNLLKEIGTESKAIVLYNDNQSAQKIVKNRQHHNRTKHIDIKYHFIRDALSKGIIDIKYKPIDNMVADVLTKPLLKNKHNLYVQQLGLKKGKFTNV